MSNDQKLATRERLWPERDESQKIEALRQEIVRLSHIVASLNDDVFKLRHHQHSPLGILTVPLDSGEQNFPRGYYRNSIPMSLRDKE